MTGARKCVKVNSQLSGEYKNTSVLYKGSPQFRKDDVGNILGGRLGNNLALIITRVSSQDPGNERILVKEKYT